MNILFFLKILGIFYLIYILFFDNNIYPLYYWITSSNSIKSAVPTSNQTLLDIKTILSEINIKGYTLIDFGCGEGCVLLSLHNMFNKSIGIEINKDIAKKAKKNTNNYKDIEIINKDILQYNFKETDTVLFLYEPLFDIYPKSDAIDIYLQVFDNINKVFSKSDKDIYIIYITGVLRKDIDNNIIKQKKIKILFKKDIGSIIFNRQLYLLQYDK